MSSVLLATIIFAHTSVDRDAIWLINAESHMAQLVLAETRFTCVYYLPPGMTTPDTAADLLTGIKIDIKNGGFADQRLGDCTGGSPTWIINVYTGSVFFASRGKHGAVHLDKRSVHSEFISDYTADVAASFLAAFAAYGKPPAQEIYPCTSLSSRRSSDAVCSRYHSAWIDDKWGGEVSSLRKILAGVGEGGNNLSWLKPAFVLSYLEDRGRRTPVPGCGTEGWFLRIVQGEWGLFCEDGRSILLSNRQHYIRTYATPETPACRRTKYRIDPSSEGEQLSYNTVVTYERTITVRPQRNPNCERLADGSWRSVSTLSGSKIRREEPRELRGILTVTEETRNEMFDFVFDAKYEEGRIVSFAVYPSARPVVPFELVSFDQGGCGFSSAEQRLECDLREGVVDVPDKAITVRMPVLLSTEIF